MVDVEVEVVVVDAGDFATRSVGDPPQLETIMAKSTAIPNQESRLWRRIARGTALSTRRLIGNPVCQRQNECQH